ncbi:cobalamin-binding protein [Bordetella genomosp. 9]|uniref:Cobalamin-binding protein n=1 Tax=Bordetella genomosp. 9 TaxID=1416803 RepID=A0A1W6Z3X8_9BORD|nr:cobalamin-binding protein [Bordetella genomosp. 9]ARP88058.1 cobalamin-binding protein [Bordetella genomosp. 9]
MRAAAIAIAIMAAAAAGGAATSAAAPGGAGAVNGTTPAVSVRDDRGRAVVLPAPAARAISLAPHATELIYAAGAGSRLAGVAKGSDYPPAALSLPSVGDALSPDAERLAALQPDLVVGWQPGAVANLLPLLRAINVPVYFSDPRTLRDIPDAVARMGGLFGTEDVAGPAAAALRARIDALARRYAGRQILRVFVQAGREPLYSLNGGSIVSDALRLCGAINVFADAPIAAPQVSAESVLARRPDAVLVGTAGEETLRASEAMWRGLRLPAALSGHVIGIDADRLYRPGPRLIDATEALCQDLDRIRLDGGSPAGDPPDAGNSAPRR